MDFDFQSQTIHTSTDTMFFSLDNNPLPFALQELRIVLFLTLKIFLYVFMKGGIIIIQSKRG